MTCGFAPILGLSSSAVSLCGVFCWFGFLRSGESSWCLFLKGTVPVPAHTALCGEKKIKSPTLDLGYGRVFFLTHISYLLWQIDWASENVISYPHEASKLCLIWKILQKCHFLTSIFVLLAKILRRREKTGGSSSVYVWDTIIYPVEGSQAANTCEQARNVIL